VLSHNSLQLVHFYGVLRSLIFRIFQSRKGKKDYRFLWNFKMLFSLSVVLRYIKVFSIPAILALIPLFFNSYAPTPSKVPTTCSISSDDMNKSIDENRNLSLFLNLGLFYIPLLLSVVVSVFFILRTYFKIKKIKSEYELLTR
jgi:G protein-coupled receptor 157